MQELGTKMQVFFAITYLPQIEGEEQTHYLFIRKDKKKTAYADPYQAIRGGGTCERGGPYVERSLVDRGFSCQCERFVGYQGLNLSSRCLR